MSGLKIDTAWTTSAVTGVTLTGGVAGDLVFKYTV